MKKLIERLLIFFLGIPAVVVIVLFLPWYNNLIMNIAAVVLAAIGAVEFSVMLEKKQSRISKLESAILGALAPLAITLHVSFGFSYWVIAAIVMSGAGWALVSRIFPRSTEIETVTNQIICGFSLIVYPGFFIYWLIKMNSWNNPGAVLLFLVITFGTDSIAWLAGTLFGANNRGLIAVSPNKSIAGFIGGLLGAVLVAVCAALLFPNIFTFSNVNAPASSIIFYAVFIGFFTGIAAMLGDLAESAMKRSCNFKDSGNVMLGRGGVLDSIDSISAAAPVFFLLFSKFFQC